jgi:hypothetical protein
MDSFAANFIKLSDADSPELATMPVSTPTCPVCAKPLERATGENIPEQVHIYNCPDSHGYFFPAGQLAAFKKAQAVKIEYHKLWNVPLPSVKGVLLTGMIILVLTGGLVAGFIGLSNRQTTSSQAQGLLTSQYVRALPTSKSVLFSAQTPYDADLTLHIPSLNNFEKAFVTMDHRTHSVIVTGIPPGTYRYYYVITINGEGIQSESYMFVMPE